MSRRTIGGKYELIEQMGRGAMGDVHRATQTGLNRSVAVKFLNTDIAKNENALRRFEQEAQALGQLSNPHVATIHDYGVDGGQPYMVMEFIHGTTLDEVLGEKPLPLKVALPVFRQVLDGIGHAHKRGIVHRDIKPSNVMLTEDGHAKVIDFGIAHVSSVGRKTKFGVAIGTPAYMSPEQVRGEALDARSDIYSLGTLLYEMLTGTPPLEKESEGATMVAHVVEDAPALPKEVAPEGIVTAVEKALARDPEKRFRTTDEFLKALTGLGLPDALADNPATHYISTLSKKRSSPKATVLDSPPPLQEEPPRKVRGPKRYWMAYAAVGLVVSMAAVGFWALKLYKDRTGPIPPPPLVLKSPPPPPDSLVLPVRQTESADAPAAGRDLPLRPGAFLGTPPPAAKDRTTPVKTAPKQACTAQEILIGKCNEKEKQ